jgi:hypothetical protein
VQVLERLDSLGVEILLPWEEAGARRFAIVLTHVEVKEARAGAKDGTGQRIFLDIYFAIQATKNLHRISCQLADLGDRSNILSWPGSKFVGEVLLSLGEIELIDQVIFAALALLELSD